MCFTRRLVQRNGKLAVFAENKERYGNEFIWITKSKSLLK